MMVFALCALEETEPVNPTVDPADIRGLGTTLLVSVWCLPRSRHEYACWSLNAVEGDTTPELRLFPCTLATFSMMGAVLIHGLRCHGDLFGDGPHEPHQLTGDGDDDLVGMFPSGDQSSVAFTQPHLGFPADVLDDFGLCFKPQL
jgi:hypothetical protein